MRVSADREDRGFREDLIGSDVFIECDGVIIEKVITADEEESTVLAYATDADGEIQLTEDGESAQTVKLAGKVVIHLPPERWVVTA